MKKFLKLLLTHGILTFVVTFATVLESGYVPRSSVDENWPLYNSDVVEGRGWPDRFIADDPFKPNFGNIGIEDRFLLRGFLFDFIVLFILLIPVTMVLPLVAYISGKTRRP
jgi:hypothetical protein